MGKLSSRLVNSCDFAPSLKFSPDATANQPGEKSAATAVHQVRRLNTVGEWLRREPTARQATHRCTWLHIFQAWDEDYGGGLPVG